MNLKKLRQSSAALMIVITISKLIGMGRDIVLANYFGTTNISDAYLIAVSVPTLLFYFIGHSLSTAYIPMYNKIKAERTDADAERYSNNLLTIALLLGTVIVILLLAVPELIVKLFAAGFDADTAAIAARLIRISCPSIYFMILVNVCGGYLQAHNSFLATGAISLPRNFAIIASIVVAAAYGIEWLGIGLLAAYVLEFLFLLPFVIKEGYRYRPTLYLRDKDMKETMYVVAPILLGMCVGQVNKIVDRSMASTVVEGGISALTYASVINNAVQEILVTGIITILFAGCARLAAEGEHEAVKAKLSGTVNTLVFLLIPASFGVIVLAEPLVKLVLCRGVFDENSLSMTSGALRFYTFGLLFLSIRDTLVKIFYAYKETKTTTLTSIIAICLNIVLNIILGKLIGINGLALATSISAAVNCVMLFILLRRKIGDFGTGKTMITLVKSLVAAAAMSAVIVMLMGLFENVGLNEILGLLLCTLLGACVYFMISALLWPNTVRKYIKRKSNK